MSFHGFWLWIASVTLPSRFDNRSTHSALPLGQLFDQFAGRAVALFWPFLGGSICQWFLSLLTHCLVSIATGLCSNRAFGCRSLVWWNRLFLRYRAFSLPGVAWAALYRHRFRQVLSLHWAPSSQGVLAPSGLLSLARGSSHSLRYRSATAALTSAVSVSSSTTRDQPSWKPYHSTDQALRNPPSCSGSLPLYFSNY